MAGQNRKYACKISQFEKNITHRGNVPESRIRTQNSYPVGPLILALFLFVVVGSAILQIIFSAQRGTIL
ncbi:putative ribosome associated membrane protein RAMP4 [Toxoplasma gondii TgCatPRC2]|uniref:Ribosome associated membrane protein RAMP4, putative n=15 Tax=Toxoplasma gondii TaxID=5811 RepID=A0A125YJA3_TOXGM|nr:ribosome associated membrane protein RAMP4, putative [Toxoplasma gondii ME49]EPR63117.1 putative ribosome associated membrane protein RAMP4 [Toxoplasma gondii GT1]ESS34675.1 putative ribosome associated membrane protein RAMP4 [Toxoplasma gondii VEG]KAF4639029.1 putative ribosome associated membrane protein RAMP4 [Toxoplasma gondii]KFG28007.1 putative ribosome associated membrane protein RAMP4 [Toxoplasma gondii p89]KFG33164.1 putative ribosome associated membrane protein RAMP4 [Toxoplasma g|eukprot:XP_008888730.1 ribosome associated membrane protein RAMP4, putative [Hammondia hammondi]